MEMLNHLRELNMTSIIFRYALAIICGGLIGIERGKKHHSAGLRTHLIICLASATTMMTSQFIFTTMNSNIDPGRLGAQVISGVGFIGVGTIVAKSKAQISGLTTAAGLWASACMGISIGIGFYEGAIILCMILYSVLAILEHVDENYIKGSSVEQLYIEYGCKTKLSEIIEPIQDLNWKIVKIEYLECKNDEINSLFLYIMNPSVRETAFVVVKRLKIIKGIEYVTKI